MLLVALAALQAGCGSSSHSAESSPATTTVPTTGTAQTAQQACPSQQGAGILANFGTRATAAEANELLARAGAVGFQGLVVQQRSCHAYAVVLGGLKSVQQGRELQREAHSAGLPVTIDCRSQPVRGGIAAVFGHRRTRAAAVTLAREAERVGFRDLQVQQDRCNDWEVDLYGIQTQAQQRELAHEAASVGFHLAFEPG